MIKTPRRLLIGSIAAAVLVSSTLADARTQTFVAPQARPQTTANLRSPFALRPFANSTIRGTFVAGGATLPALAYEGANALYNNPSSPAAGTIFQQFRNVSDVKIYYCQTGSGFGKKVFDGLAGATGGVNGPCPALGTANASTSGFGAPASLALTDPDVTGADSPLAQSEYSAFVGNKAATRGEPVELPSIIGSIALFYNYPAGTIKLNLTDAEICALVEGKITNWSQLGLASHPLTFIARSDGSGTTFSFSNHLSAVCGSGSGLSTSQQFAPVAGSSAPYVQPNPPSNFLGASGNAGVVNAIRATAYSIGYVEAANAKAAVGGALGYATVNGKDPIKNLPETSAAFVYNNGSTVVSDSAVVTTGGPARTTLFTGVAKSGCVRLAIPSAYANITKGYPIIAVTYLLFSSAENGGTNASNLRQLITTLNTPSNFGSTITSVDAPTATPGTGMTGYSALNSSFNSPLTIVAANCIGA